MRKLTILLICCAVHTTLLAQNKVQFILTDMAEHKRDSVFIAGSFNNWDSLRNEQYLLKDQGDGQLSITLSMPQGEILYKYHGGDWKSVEKSWWGFEVNNRLLSIDADKVVRDTVLEWRDLFLIDKWQVIRETNSDTTRVSLYSALAAAYGYNPDYYNMDSSMYYIQKVMSTVKSSKSSEELQNWSGYEAWVADARLINASVLHRLANYSQSLEELLEVLNSLDDIKYPQMAVETSMSIAETYMSMKDFTNALDYCYKARQFQTRLDTGDPDYIRLRNWLVGDLSTIFLSLSMGDSAYYYSKYLYRLGIENRLNDIQSFYHIAWAASLMGNYHYSHGDMDSAKYYYNKALTQKTPFRLDGMVLNYKGLALVYQKLGQLDSALFYAQSALQTIDQNESQVLAWSNNPSTYKAEILPIVAELYGSKNHLDKAYAYLQRSVKLKDSLFNEDKIRQFQNLTFNESLRKQQEAQKETEARQKYQSQLKIYGLIFGVASLFLVSTILFRNNNQKQKANKVLKDQKNKVENTLTELRLTQAQLIQSEKMASLGELTAGIAHEIQNPLNFVNNFSDVNTELIQELQEALNRGDHEEVKQVLKSLKENEEKIKIHGQRADGIVKGMLQHSRGSSDKKELTDINNLCDEYLRLSYHGLRAKDKTFNAKFESDFDPSIPKMNVVPQDLGRVILNLINNAFYAVGEKKRNESLAGLKDSQGLDEPAVTITTKNLGDKIEIRIKDNGNGIPDPIKEKIFQPFFTTKPSGKGTGLGLSLAYDIITKGHGGKIEVESEENSGTEFIISLHI